MASEPQILYLEPDDEITSVVRRLRETDASRLVLVAPGRTKATSSVVALRLLAGVAAEEGRGLALVADPLARTLAGEAGIPAFASVAEATTGDAVTAATTPARRATIHVVRPEATAQARPAPAASHAAATDETRPVPVARRRPPAVRRAVAPQRRSMIPMLGIALIVAALLAAGGVAAVVLPAATIRITPEAKLVGPVDDRVTPADQQHVSGEIQKTMTGDATGDHVERTRASGTVVFQSGNPGRCRVPQGTRVAAGKVVFETVETVVVPEGKFTGHGIDPGAKSAGIVAVAAGPAGNVPADAIDTIQDDGLTFCLRGFPNTTHRIVTNPKATGGGKETHTPEVTQADVDALREQISSALRADLAADLAKHDDRLVLAPENPEKATIAVPKDLVGTRGSKTFELSGTLAYDRLSVARADVDAAARERLKANKAILPDDATLDPQSIEVRIGKPSLVDGVVTVAVTVTALAVPDLDVDAMRQRLHGKTAAEASTMLAGVGEVSVDLWPAWVNRIPSMDWRVTIDVAAVPDASAAPSGTP